MASCGVTNLRRFISGCDSRNSAFRCILAMHAELAPASLLKTGTSTTFRHAESSSFVMSWNSGVGKLKNSGVVSGVAAG